MDINQDIDPPKFVAIFEETLKNSNMTKTEVAWSFGMEPGKKFEINF